MARWRLDGPGSINDKILYQEMKRRGIVGAKLPAQLRDSIVAKSKKGPIGVIALRKMTGVQTGPALKIVQRFEENVGGKDDVIEKLQALDTLSKEQSRFLQALINSGTKSLARVLAEEGVEPVAIMKSYAKGCIELGKYEAAIVAHKNLPALVKEYYKHALSEKGYCGACGGSGKVHKRAGDHKDLEGCLFCEGSGITLESGMKESAMAKMLEVTKMVGKDPAISVTTNVGVKVGAGEGYSVFEKIMGAGDEVLYRKDRGREGEIIEAEVVKE
jgi:hypothetical protein